MLLIQNKPFCIAEQMMTRQSIFCEAKDHARHKEAEEKRLERRPQGHQEGHADVLSSDAERRHYHPDPLDMMMRRCMLCVRHTSTAQKFGRVD